MALSLKLIFFDAIFFSSKSLYFSSIIKRLSLCMPSNFLISVFSASSCWLIMSRARCKAELSPFVTIPSVCSMLEGAGVFWNYNLLKPKLRSFGLVLLSSLTSSIAGVPSPFYSLLASNCTSDSSFGSLRSRKSLAYFSRLSWWCYSSFLASSCYLYRLLRLDWTTSFWISFWLYWI